MSDYEQLSIVEAVKGRELEFPTITQAAENVHPAYSAKIEWLSDRIEGGKLVRVAEFNFCQIQRNPYTDDREEALTRHLQGIERTLIDGVRGLDLQGANPIGFCGGVLNLLGHRPMPDDYLELRLLRDLRHYNGDKPEFLTEFSLLARSVGVAA